MSDKQHIHVVETCGTYRRRSYHVKPSALNFKTQEIFIQERNRQWQSLTRFFMTAFLPHGYPESVSNDYLQYQIWDSIQAFASSIVGGICTHSVLTGVGVGNENASPLAATISWLIKDGTSMIGRIVFAWFQGTKLDCDCKKWRLFADVLNDFAMFMDLISGYFQNYFVFILCISGVCKSIVGVAGGSTRAAITQHQARENNMADVSAKDGSQETLVNLMALIVSLIIIPVVTQNIVLTWVIFAIMTTVHLSANYLAVRSVTMETFNIERFKIFVDSYLSDRKCSSVVEVNQKENLFFSFKQEKSTITLGSSFKEIIANRAQEFKEILELYRNCNYILAITSTETSRVAINILFSQKASPKTLMEALYQGCVLDYMIENKYNENAMSDWGLLLSCF